MTGGASWSEEPRGFNIDSDGGQLVTIFLLTIVMLNLLIGILSDKIAEIVSLREIRNYQIILDNCIEIENALSGVE
jgi:hypothetical protein